MMIVQNVYNVDLNSVYSNDIICQSYNDSELNISFSPNPALGNYCIAGHYLDKTSTPHVYNMSNHIMICNSIVCNSRLDQSGASTVNISFRGISNNGNPGLVMGSLVKQQ